MSCYTNILKYNIVLKCNSTIPYIHDGTIVKLSRFRGGCSYMWPYPVLFFSVFFCEFLVAGVLMVGTGGYCIHGPSPFVLIGASDVCFSRGKRSRRCGSGMLIPRVFLVCRLSGGQRLMLA